MKTKVPKIQQPDYRNNGRLQFVTGYTGGGAEMCAHLTFKQYEARVRAKYGPGRLIEEGGIFKWQPAKAAA